MNADEKELQQNFRDAAAPRKEFLQALKQEVMATASVKPRSNLLSSIMVKLSQTQLKFGAIAAFVFVGVGVTVAYTLMVPRTMYSAADQAAIFANIAANNSRTQNSGASASPLLSESSNKSATNDAAAPSSKMSAIWYQDPEKRGYVYKKTTNTYKTGNSMKSCLLMVPYEGVVTSDEFSQYFSNKNDYTPSHTKSVMYAGNDIYEYYLNINNDQWQYIGGSYAVHLKNVQRVMPLAADGALYKNEATTLPGNAPIKDDQMPPISNTPTPTNPISSYFGEDAKIIGTETINGKKYYRVRWSFKGMCDAGTISKAAVVSNRPADDTIIVESLANAETFVIAEESYYYHKYGDSNLIYTRKTIEETTKSFSAEEAGKEFSFNYPVTVKEIDASRFSYENEYRDAVIDYVQKKELNPSVLTTKGSSVQSVSSNYVTIIPETSAFLVDRAYYPNTDYGQKRYDQNKDMFKPYFESGVTYPDLMLSYSLNNAVTSWVSVAEYAQTVDAVKAIKGAFGVDSTQLTNKGTTKVSVDGTSITATLFEQEMTPIVEPMDSSRGTTKEQFQADIYASRFAVVNTAKGMFIVMFSQPQKSNMIDFVKTLSFKTILSSDKTGLLAAFKVNQSNIVGPLRQTKPD